MEGKRQFHLAEPLGDQVQVQPHERQFSSAIYLVIVFQFSKMPSKEGWAEDYMKCLSSQSEGWAIYSPIKSSALKPGMCGYFDIDGIWQTIVDLTDPDDVKSKNLPPVHDVVFSGGNLASTKHWGLRTSRDIKQDDISAELNVK